MSEDRLAALEARIAACEGVIAALRQAFGGGAGGAGEIASDRELDDPKYGDPIVRISPRDWKGDSFKGRHFSECDPDFLDVLAESYLYFAEKNDAVGARVGSKPKSFYDRAAARRARGWARRIRAGWTPPEQPASNGGAKANPFANGAGLAVPAAPLPSRNPFAPTPAPPATPPAAPPPSSGDDDDISFDFGANATRKAPATDDLLTDDPDDLDEAPL